MDPFKLLSRSTKLSRDPKRNAHHTIPSGGQTGLPQLFGSPKSTSQSSRKRKRGQDALSKPQNNTAAIELATGASDDDGTEMRHTTQHGGSRDAERTALVVDVDPEKVSPLETIPSLEEYKHILRQHKVKVTWLNPPRAPKKARRKTEDNSEAEKTKVLLFPNPVQSFDCLRSRYGISKNLEANLADQGFKVPTEVQLGALPFLLDDSLGQTSVPELHTAQTNGDGINLLTVAPTGSGKTLAYLIPILHHLQRRKRKQSTQDNHTSIIILAPTKELAGQITNEGRKLAKNTGITISQMRKGMRFDEGSERYDIDNTNNEKRSVVKSDIVVSTPGVLSIAVNDCKSESLALVSDLILDEGDVLLDPLFRDQTLEIWNSLSNKALRISVWSATMGSNVEELIKNTINERRQRLATVNASTVPGAPLIRVVIGLKDSAVPNVEHKLVYAATEQGKLMGLRQLLHPTTTSIDTGSPLRPPFLVFTQTIERAVALHAELLYDIPAEAGGIRRIAVLHADLSDPARESIMTRFRKGEIWVLITTDLLSRGVDFRGINGVVNYDIPTSSAAYVHRVGRTGRAGREGGVAVTLYSKEDIPYLKHIANVVAMVQKQKSTECGMQQWLLDAIPSLSKNDKQSLKKHGVESRNTRGKERDPKAARKQRISTKAGFVRRIENNRKGAIRRSQLRAQTEFGSDAGDETDFGGFD